MLYKFSSPHLEVDGSNIGGARASNTTLSRGEPNGRGDRLPGKDTSEKSDKILELYLPKDKTVRRTCFRSQLPTKFGEILEIENPVARQPLAELLRDHFQTQEDLDQLMHDLDISEVRWIPKPVVTVDKSYESDAPKQSEETTVVPGALAADLPHGGLPLPEFNLHEVGVRKRADKLPEYTFPFRGVSQPSVIDLTSSSVVTGSLATPSTDRLSIRRHSQPLVIDLISSSTGTLPSVERPTTSDGVRRSTPAPPLFDFGQPHDWLSSPAAAPIFGNPSYTNLLAHLLTMAERDARQCLGDVDPLVARFCNATPRATGFDHDATFGLRALHPFEHDAKIGAAGELYVSRSNHLVQRRITT